MKINTEVITQLETINNQQSVTKQNTFYNPDFADIILQRYIPFLHMWTLLMESPKERRVSNNPVERYFGILKNNVLQNQKYLAPTVFLRTVRRYVSTIFTELSLGIPKDRLAIAPKQKGKCISILIYL